MEFTGNTAAVDAVTLVARVEGYLEGIHFTDGALVKKGDLLFSIQKDSSLASMHAAEAQVALAKLNVSYTRVTAPFDGSIGRHMIDVGNLVGGTGQPQTLATIDRIDPLYVYFTIDERDLLRIKAQRDRDRLAGTSDVIPARFGLMEEEGFPHEGRLDYASLSVAPRTGTLAVRGIFPNPEGIFPGLFVRVQVSADTSRQALVIPADALAFDQQGEYVLVVGQDDVVARRAIKTGEQVGEQIVVTSGLEQSDRVVVAGLQRAIPGRKVTPQTAPPPAAKPPASPPAAAPH